MPKKRFSAEQKHKRVELPPVVTAAMLRGCRFPSIQICSHARGTLAGFSGLV